MSQLKNNCSHYYKLSLLLKIVVLVLLFNSSGECILTSSNRSVLGRQKSPPVSIAPQFPPQPPRVLSLNSFRNYLDNERFYPLLARCLFLNGPCDSIGKWVKYRLNSAIPGSYKRCDFCTDEELEIVADFLTKFDSFDHELLRMGLIKTIESRISAPNFPQSLNSLDSSEREELAAFDAQIKKVLNEADFYNRESRSSLHDVNREEDHYHRPLSFQIPILH